jgi:hypothetical protein
MPLLTELAAFGWSRSTNMSRLRCFGIVALRCIAVSGLKFPFARVGDRV